MSRTYKDWEKKKSVIIRSLFHNISTLPQVDEESNYSSQDYYVPAQEPFPSPPRPYSPLPPLIIEEVPLTNKHDEPEDYYNKLFIKIKRIYENIFIEKRNFSSLYYDSNYSSVNDSDGSVENQDFQFMENNDNSGNYKDNFDSIIEDDERDARQSSATTKTDGYGADFESMDTTSIEVVHYTSSDEEDLIASEEEDENDIRNDDSDSSTSSDNNESSRERIDYPELRGREESRHSTIDDDEMTEGAEPYEKDDKQSNEKEGSDNENIDGHDIIVETSQTGESDTIRKNNLEISGGEESHYSSSDDHENSESEESNEIEDEPQPNNATQRKPPSFVKEIKSKEFEKTAFEDSNELIDSNVEPMEAEVESSDSSEGPVYRQITTAAMVHYDGTQDAEERESQVYEDSAKSVILPTWSRRVVFRRNDDVDDRIEVSQMLKNNAVSNTIPSFNTDKTTEKGFEEATTSTLAAKEEGIIEMRPNQLEEDDEQMSTPRLDAPEEDGEEMTTPHPEPAEEDVEGIGSSQPAARNEETEEMENPLPETTVEDVEGMSTLPLDAPEEVDKEMTTPQARSAGEKVDGMKSPQSAAGGKETEATEVDVEKMGSFDPIEQMRTPRPNLSHDTIPITYRSHSESTSEHTAAPQEHTAITSSTQDGADHDMSEIQTSNDMGEILTSIFNASRNKDGTPISGRKRKLVDKAVQAVQTSKVPWEEMRANFFVGTPKIFRLCACTDHICY